VNNVSPWNHEIYLLPFTNDKNQLTVITKFKEETGAH